MTGLYVHVPFCSALCPYCDFAVVVGRADAHEGYFDALDTEFRAAGSTDAFETVFFGGGTPTFVDPTLLTRFLDLVEHTPDAEITIEANPDSVDVHHLSTLADAGINRVSIGAQSFAEHVLRALGRTHDARDIGRAADAARAAGIENLSLDLIYGTPEESDDDWATSLKEAIALEPTHLSCYALTIEERTPFGQALARGTMREPDEDVVATRYETACNFLAANGFEQYEVSNWARPGFACRHNVTYWTQGDYLGLGLGAHSHRAGHRWWNTRSLTRYLADPAGAREGEEHLDDRERAEEWLALCVRLVAGFDLRDAEARLGPLQAEVEALVEAGLAARDGTRVHLTPRGMLLDNDVTARLLSAS